MLVAGIPIGEVSDHAAFACDLLKLHGIRRDFGLVIACVKKGEHEHEYGNDGWTHADMGGHMLK